MTGIAIIAAVDEAWGIARDGKIPWRNMKDLSIFQKLTDGCPVIVGRKTWDSIEKELPGRNVIVLTKDPEYEPKYKAHVANNAYYAMDLAVGLSESPGEYELHTIFIAGGREIYKLFLEMPDPEYMVDTMYISEIKRNYDCDTFFPFAGLADVKWAMSRSRIETFDESSDDWDFTIYKRLTDKEREITNKLLNIF